MQKLVSDQPFNVISSVKGGTLGEVLEILDGRKFRYGLAGASNLAIGKLTQAALGTANHQNLVVTTAQAAGDQSVTVTLGGSAVTSNQYADGYALIYDSAGAGQALRIRNHGPQATTTGNVVLNLADPITTAITTSTKVSITNNPWSNLIISDHTPTTAVVTGVPCIAVTAAYFGWFQVQGIAAVLTNGTPAVGAGVIESATTDGAVDVEGTSTVTHRIGTVHSVSAVSAKYNDIALSIVV